MFKKFIKDFLATPPPKYIIDKENQKFVGIITLENNGNYWITPELAEEIKGKMKNGVDFVRIIYFRYYIPFFERGYPEGILPNTYDAGDINLKQIIRFSAVREFNLLKRNPEYKES